MRVGSSWWPVSRNWPREMRFDSHPGTKATWSSSMLFMLDRKMMTVPTSSERMIFFPAVLNSMHIGRRSLNSDRLLQRWRDAPESKYQTWSGFSSKLCWRVSLTAADSLAIKADAALPGAKGSGSESSTCWSMALFALAWDRDCCEWDDLDGSDCWRLSYRRGVSVSPSSIGNNTTICYSSCDCILETAILTYLNPELRDCWSNYYCCHILPYQAKNQLTHRLTQLLTTTRARDYVEGLQICTQYQTKAGLPPTFESKPRLMSLKTKQMQNQNSDASRFPPNHPNRTSPISPSTYTQRLLLPLISHIKSSKREFISQHPIEHQEAIKFQVGP